MFFFLTAAMSYISGQEVTGRALLTKTHASIFYWSKDREPGRPFILMRPRTKTSRRMSDTRAPLKNRHFHIHTQIRSCITRELMAGGHCKAKIDDPVIDFLMFREMNCMPPPWIIFTFILKSSFARTAAGKLDIVSSSPMRKINLSLIESISPREKVLAND